MVKVYDTRELSVAEIIKRTEADTSAVEAAVAAIIAKVRSEGDSALKEYTLKFDGCALDSLKVSEKELSEAFEQADPYFVETLKEARANIALFHSKQLREEIRIQKADGVILGQKFLPVARAGLYVPGGTASYPSSVLMDIVPAQLAGVKEIVLCTPPAKDGKINPSILVAAKLAGATSIYKVGGAQAIAAMAYGTESIPKVDKIVGPGNIFVATAKKQVFGAVSIDMIAGPSEILVIADANSNPKFVAADLLSQAEHDKMSSAVLITDSRAFADEVNEELTRQVELLPRCAIAKASLNSNGKLIVAKDLEEAVEISNEIAPEHLELCVNNPFELLDKVKNAGSVFLGRNTPEAIGDYFAGANHTLPTVGTAKFSSPLSVDDFIKKTQYIYYTDVALEKAKDRVADFAEREGLTAHARSIQVRFEDKK